MAYFLGTICLKIKPLLANNVISSYDWTQIIKCFMQTSLWTTSTVSVNHDSSISYDRNLGLSGQTFLSHKFK